MKKSIINFVLILMLALSPLFGNGQKESSKQIGNRAIPDKRIVITDSLGREVILDHIPQRIVQVGGAAFIINDALFLFPEALDRLVAYSEGNQGNGDFPRLLDPEANEKPMFKKSVNIEEVLGMNPDLVIMKNFTYKKYAPQFEQLGIPVVFLDLETPEAWQNDLNTIGQIFDNPERAKELQGQFQSWIKRAEAVRLENQKEQKKVLILYYSQKNGTKAFKIPPQSYIQTTMTQMAGASPVWLDASTGSRWTTINFEQIAKWNPDKIYLVTYHTPMGGILKDINQSSEWKELEAYKNKQIIAFPSDFYSWDQPDTRWLLGLQWLSMDLYPEAYKGENIEDYAREFYKEFYSVDFKPEWLNSREK